MTTTANLTQPQADALGRLDHQLPNPGTVDGRVAAALERQGLIRRSGRASNHAALWTLTPAGTLRILADLAGWSIPADLGDPYVIGVCALNVFVSCPDKVGDHLATLELWHHWRPLLADLLGPDRPPIAWVAQNGATPDTIPTDAEAVFIGGNDQGQGDWKDSATARDIILEAKALGLHAHVGRVNSLKRIAAAASAGADTVDGTYLRWGPDKNLARLLRFLDAVDRQGPELFPAGTT